jgi:hypothetical protein
MSTNVRLLITHNLLPTMGTPALGLLRPLFSITHRLYNSSKQAKHFGVNKNGQQISSRKRKDTKIALQGECDVAKVLDVAN